MKIGANYLGNGTCEFVAWAPFKTKVELKIILPEEKIIPMQKDEWGYWKATVINFSPDHLYLYRLDEEKKMVLVRRRQGQSQVLVIFNFNNAEVRFAASQYKGAWEKILDSSDKIWRGPGALLPERITLGKELRIRGHSFAVFRKWKNGKRFFGDPLAAH